MRARARGAPARGPRARRADGASRTAEGGERDDDARSRARATPADRSLALLRGGGYTE